MSDFDRGVDRFPDVFRAKLEEAFGKLPADAVEPPPVEEIVALAQQARFEASVNVIGRVVVAPWMGSALLELDGRYFHIPQNEWLTLQQPERERKPW